MVAAVQLCKRIVASPTCTVVVGAAELKPASGFENAETEGCSAVIGDRTLSVYHVWVVTPLRGRVRKNYTNRQTELEEQVHFPTSPYPSYCLRRPRRRKARRRFGLEFPAPSACI